MCLDFDHLEEEISALNDAQVDGFHVDIMDGRFVRNFAPLANLLRVRPLTDKPIGVHLMVEDPAEYLPRIYACRPEVIYVHYEVARCREYLLDIRAQGIKAGMVVSPGTTISQFKHLLPHVDILLIMRVKPGYIGQPNVPEVEDKIDLLTQMKNRTFALALDGCVTHEIVQKWRAAGVERFVCGMSSKLFDAKSCSSANYSRVLEALRAGGCAPGAERVIQ